MKKTLKDLAEMIGFSPATISRVLTNDDCVSKNTRDAVLAALRNIDYIPSRASRKRTASKPIMFIAPDTTGSFHANVFAAINEELTSRGFILLIGDVGYDRLRTEKYIEYAQEHSFSGIIMLFPMESPGIVRMLRAAKCPIVLVGSYFRSEDFDAVYMDNYRAGYIVGDYLLKMGHRKIICLASGSGNDSMKDRRAGFTDALTDFGIPQEDICFWDGNERRESGREFAEVYASRFRKYTAVFTLNGLMAQGFSEAVLEKGLSIPEDISVICISPEVQSIYGRVKLTCVIHDSKQLASAAVGLLLDRMNDLNQKPSKISYPPLLNLQQSVRKIK